MPSPSHRIALAFRSIAAPGKSAADAHAYAQRLRMHYLADAASPPRQRFVDLATERYSTLPFYDERYFDDVHAIVSVEPVRPEDRLMMGMLASLGVERGKPLARDQGTRRIPSSSRDDSVVRPLSV